MLYRSFSTQEEIDREYDVERMVPDFRPYAKHFIEESAKARAELPSKLDLRFGPTLDEYIDYFPAPQPDSPLLVFIHGGYWRLLSAKEFSLVARGPHARGVAVAVTNYSLCPKVTIAEITRQSRAAVAWLYAHASQLGINRESIFVSGHSAGGQQVGMLAATDWPGDYGLPPDVIKGALAISGLFDLEPLRYSWLQPKLQLDFAEIRGQSPIYHIPRKAPPLVVTLGGEESAEFHRQSRDYLAAWQAAGLPGRWLDQPGCNHFTAIYGLNERDSDLCRALDEMIRGSLNVGRRHAERQKSIEFPTFGPVA
jgi:arylformamidase